MSHTVSVTKFVEALESIGKPGGNQLAYLQAHFDAPGKASTATVLAKAAGYKSWRTLNLQYGRLAARISQALDMQGGRLGTLLDFGSPRSVSNEHWLLIMKPEFAKALVRAGWVNVA